MHRKVNDSANGNFLTFCPQLFDTYKKNIIFAFHKICNTKCVIDVKRYGTTE